MRCFLTIALLCFSFIFVQYSCALSFSTIEVHSYLNQKLNARIYFKETTDDKTSDYQYSLAPLTIFNQQKIPFSSVIRDLKFQLITNKHTAPYLSVTTKNKLITSSKLDFLLTARNTMTQDTHTYRVKLTIHPSPLYMSKKKKYFNMGNEHKTLTYGPTTTKDTLMQISREMRPNATITLNQMMLAIVKRNPDAFYQQNVNGLQAGRLLKMPSIKMINSVNPNNAMREVIRQNNLWKDILKQQTELKQNYSAELSNEEQQAKQEAIVENKKILKQENDQLEAKNKDDHKIEQVDQEKFGNSNIEPGDLVSNTFSLGYESASFLDNSTLLGTTDHEVKGHGLGYVTATDKLFSPIGRHYYTEGKISLSYNLSGSITHQAWLNGLQTTNSGGKTSHPVNFQSQIGFGVPIFGGTKFYSAPFQDIFVLGGYYNGQHILSNAFYDRVGGEQLGNISGDILWYGGYLGNEAKLRFKKLEVDAGLKYYLGKYYVEGSEFLGADMLKQSGRSNGLEISLLFAYDLKHRWQITWGYDYQNFKSRDASNSIVNIGDIATNDVVLNELFWRSSLYTIGLRHRF